MPCVTVLGNFDLSWRTILGLQIEGVVPPRCCRQNLNLEMRKATYRIWMCARPSGNLRLSLQSNAHPSAGFRDHTSLRHTRTTKRTSWTRLVRGHMAQDTARCVSPANMPSLHLPFLPLLRPPPSYPARAGPKVSTRKVAIENGEGRKVERRTR